MSSQTARKKYPIHKPVGSPSFIAPVPNKSSQTALRKFPNIKPAEKPVSVVPVTAYNCTELLETLDAIRKIIQCYSCHKQIHSARTCLNGHGVCWTCKNRCNKLCPLCKSPIIDSKPVMLNEIIKLLPRKCNFLTKGCEGFVLANDYDHETFCRFRNTTCRMHSCEWKGMAKDLLLHLENFHGREMIRTSTQSQILMSFNTYEDREGLAVIVAFNNIFWQHIRVREKQLYQFYQFIPMEKPTRKFSVLITFYTPEISYSGCTPVHTDAFDPEQLFRDKETFCLPKKTATSFNRFPSGVHYSFKITHRDN